MMHDSSLLYWSQWPACFSCITSWGLSVWSSCTEIIPRLSIETHKVIFFWTDRRSSNKVWSSGESQLILDWEVFVGCYVSAQSWQPCLSPDCLLIVDAYRCSRNFSVSLCLFKFSLNVLLASDFQFVCTARVRRYRTRQRENRLKYKLTSWHTLWCLQINCCLLLGDTGRVTESDFSLSRP